MVESLPSKQVVAGSSPVSRSRYSPQIEAYLICRLIFVHWLYKKGHTGGVKAESREDVALLKIAEED